ncbi:hypothetical protein OG800_32180 [Streptomyces sp. NBC_00445]|uniref:hypothetical protein n=1 Tax=unclassified Streptomyces TaxID=2593676 RepID=UPI002E1BB7A2|nr:MULTISPECIES: hypothetical protein [unclassified Streptomyces]
MTILQLKPRSTVVRAAGLVDVPAVVRLLAPAATASRPALPVPEGPAVDWEQAQRAMRLMLAHYALEEGEVWVAERADGQLLAAAVWLPPGTGTEPHHTRFGSLLARELDTCVPEKPKEAVLPAAPALQAAGLDGPYWTVVAACAPDDTEAWDRSVVAELLAPGLRAVDGEGVGAVAATISPRHMDQLRPLGFRHPRAARLAPGVGVWLAPRDPISHLAA